MKKDREFCLDRSIATLILLPDVRSDGGPVVPDFATRCQVRGGRHPLTQGPGRGHPRYPRSSWGGGGGYTLHTGVLYF